MARAVSPLRYPGGKTCLYPLVSSLLAANNLERRHYAEPFAGGCGLALSLLYGGNVSDIHINEVDSSIWAFWHSVLNHVEEIAHMIANTPVTVQEWLRQRSIYLRQDEGDVLSLGFSAFFLNRTTVRASSKGRCHRWHCAKLARIKSTAGLTRRRLLGATATSSEVPQTNSFNKF